MLECWNVDATCRPAFEDLEADFAEMMPQSTLVTMKEEAREEDKQYNVRFQFIYHEYLSMNGGNGGGKNHVEADAVREDMHEEQVR